MFNRKLLQAAQSRGMPRGNIAPHWTQIVAEDFNSVVAAPTDTFLATYNPSNAATGWQAYNGFADTSGKGTYDTSNNTLTAHDSLLDIFIHAGTGTTRYVACVLPNGYTGHTYMKVTWRMHMDVVGPDYKIVPLLWPASNNWTEGEVDFPENAIGYGAGINITLHENSTGPSPTQGHGTNYPGLSIADDHIYDMEWTPDLLNFWVDGVLIRTTSNSIVIPTTPMIWRIQLEVNPAAASTPTPVNTEQGHVYVDWVTMYTYS